MAHKSFILFIATLKKYAIDLRFLKCPSIGQFYSSKKIQVHSLLAKRTVVINFRNKGNREQLLWQNHIWHPRL